MSETPEVHLSLVHSLEAAGLQVLALATLNAATLALSDAAAPPFAVILDMHSPQHVDFDWLETLNARYPHVHAMLFAGSGWPAKVSKDIFDRLQGFHSLRVLARPLADPDSYRLVAETVVSPPAANEIRNRHIGTTCGKLPDSRERSGIQDVGVPLYSEQFLRRVGLSDVPVLLHGETGVGKEVMARRLWTYSSRVGKPFLKLNCAALPSELIESELFGYEKGAFTGATVDKPGKFELAQNGTILLDEIGDMDIRLQAKLLQVLQDGEVQPLGSGRTVKVNVRVMAATHRDLRGAIALGSFREDLYYRLSVINITVPALRQRRDEILPLAEKLLLRHMAPGAVPPSIPAPLREAMLAHPWPGNVRELENLMRRFLIYQDADLLVSELTASLTPARRRRSTDKVTEIARPAMSFDRFAEASRTAESRLLLDTLESVRWNRRQAALRLDIDYKALLYKLQKHGIVEAKAKRGEVSA